MNKLNCGGTMNLENNESTCAGKSSRAWAGLLVLVATGLIAVLQAGVSYPALAQPNLSKASWQSELSAWEARWSALLAQRPPGDAAKWNALEAELDALARKYGQANQQQVHKQASSKPTTMGSAELSPCPPRDDIPGYRCYLFPGPKGVCRYVCSPITKK